VLVGILTAFSIGSVYFNGLAGTGATFFGLVIQTICAAVYLAYIYIVVNHTNLGLPWAWASEILYWIVMMGIVLWYMRSQRWHGLEV
jgi:Na+-driven multidrug efflux pump